MRRHLIAVLLSSCVSAVLHAQTFAYVGSRYEPNVAVIDTATNAVVATVPLPALMAGGPVASTHMMAMSPDGNRVYVSTFQNSAPFTWTIVAIDTATSSVASTISVPGAARLAVSPDSARLYVATVLNGAGSVTVVDTATNSVSGSIALPATSRPYMIAATPTQVYIDDSSSGDVYVADAATNALIATIPPSGIGGAYGMALSSDGSRLYYQNTQGVFSVVDTATNTTLSTAAVDAIFASFEITPDGGKLYAVGIPDDGPFYTIDTATFALTTITDYSQAWFDAAIAPDGALAYLCNFDHASVVAFDTATNTPVATIPLPSTQVRGATPAAIVVGHIPPAIPFAAFNVAKLQVNSQGFSENGSFTLGAAAAFDPATQRVSLTAGSFTLDIPPGSFRRDGPNLHWTFEGKVGGARVNADIKQQGRSTTQFAYSAAVKGPDLTAQARPLRVGLRIGPNVGSALVP